jgi:hypothetical protein
VQRVPLQTSLFWRVFAINAGRFIVAALALALTAVPRAVIVAMGLATLTVAESCFFGPPRSAPGDVGDRSSHARGGAADRA